MTETAVTKLGNLSQNIVPLQLASGKWIIADSGLVSNNTEYEDIGAAYNSAIAVKRGDKWGVLALDGTELVPFEHDGVVMDELGRCYAQESVFVRQGGKAYLISGGAMQGEPYDDARPFTDDGWAAVKKDGKWGFIDNAGQFMIQPQYEDALSFSGHLASVKLNGLWGYASLGGATAIEPVYTEAKSFHNGTAPVMTEKGWQFITLVEYE
jgi:hypothetical protein